MCKAFFPCAFKQKVPHCSVAPPLRPSISNVNGIVNHFIILRTRCGKNNKRSHSGIMFFVEICQIFNYLLLALSFEERRKGHEQGDLVNDVAKVVSIRKEA